VKRAGAAGSEASHMRRGHALLSSSLVLASTLTGRMFLFNERQTLIQRSHFTGRFSTHSFDSPILRIFHSEGSTCNLFAWW
jgi:hypothetical protein